MLKFGSRKTSAQQAAEATSLANQANLEQFTAIINALPVSILVLSPTDATVKYVNPYGVEAMRVIRSNLPSNFNPDQMLGQKIDFLKTKPLLTPSFLSVPSNLPLETEASLGTDMVRLKLAAMYDSDGKYIGAIVTWRIVSRTLQAIDAFRKKLNDSLTEVADATMDIMSAAGQVGDLSQKSTSQVDHARHSAMETSTNVQTVASAAEELSSSIIEISRQVSESSRISQEAVVEADRTNATVQGLARSSDKIGEVVNLIQDIASQTNLLALNATIEAARAGEAGKGFAVVASEVKNLANQTAKATEEIAAQINEIQTSTTGAVKAIQGIGKTIHQISEITSAIAAAVEEQGAATGEISRSAQQAASGTDALSHDVETISTAAAETNKAATGVSDAGEALKNSTQKTRDEIDKLLAEIAKA